MQDWHPEIKMLSNDPISVITNPTLVINFPSPFELRLRNSFNDQTLPSSRRKRILFFQNSCRTSHCRDMDSPAAPLQWPVLRSFAVASFTLLCSGQFYAPLQWSVLRSFAVASFTLLCSGQFYAPLQWPVLRSFAVASFTLLCSGQYYAPLQWSVLRSFAVASFTLLCSGQFYAPLQWPVLRSFAVASFTLLCSGQFYALLLCPVLGFEHLYIAASLDYWTSYFTNMKLS